MSHLQRLSEEFHFLYRPQACETSTTDNRNSDVVTLHMRLFIIYDSLIKEMGNHDSMWRYVRAAICSQTMLLEPFFYHSALITRPENVRFTVVPFIKSDKINLISSLKLLYNPNLYFQSVLCFLNVCSCLVFIYYAM